MTTTIYDRPATLDNCPIVRPQYAASVTGSTQLPWFAVRPRGTVDLEARLLLRPQ